MITREGLADLDELVLCCRSEQARSYISEAVTCYKAGAHRQCIVATWIAVVYDYIDKLRQLELSGNKAAAQMMKEVEKICAADDPKRSLDFERGMLDSAKDEFELLTPLEYMDLIRLRDDRNRCAHPSMNRLDEAYQPTAELARTHLRNAVTHLLQHPPVQGKNALSRLESQVASEYFPQEVAAAVKYFANGPLAKPRESLVRNFLVVLAKRLLLEGTDGVTERRFSAAVNAVRKLHRGPSEAVLAEKLSDLMRNVDDAALGRSVAFLRLIPDTWQYVADDLHTRIVAYVESMPDQRLVSDLPGALEVRELRAAAVRRLAAVDCDHLSDLVQADVFGFHREFADRAIELYEEAPNFNLANRIGAEMLAPYAPSLSAQQIKRVIEAASTNDQVRHSFQLGPVLRRLRDAGVMPTKHFDALLAEAGLVDKLGPQKEDVQAEEEEIPF